MGFYKGLYIVAFIIGGIIGTIDYFIKKRKK